MAGHVDRLFFFLVGVSAFFAILIFALIIYFAVKYRSRPGRERAEATRTYVFLEVIWIVIPLGLTMIMFFWGAKLFLTIYRPPANAMEIFVVGKQWMWKFQHPTGQLEIDELHIPIGKPIKLTMISEDVIHDLFVPAFRIKRDVLPDRYTTVWFQATQTGRYRFFCAQYCGTEHSLMVGWVDAMKPADFQKWISGSPAAASLEEAGAGLFLKLGCSSCHGSTGSNLGPALAGIYGSQVVLTNGHIVVADDSYIRESIINPEAQVVAGYQPVMPTFKGQVSDQQMMQLIAYLKSMSPQKEEAKNK
jgi:cytochrome c oxidase subunit 2